MFGRLLDLIFVKPLSFFFLFVLLTLLIMNLFMEIELGFFVDLKGSNPY